MMIMTAFLTLRTLREDLALLLWLWLRLHLGLDHPDLRLRRPPYLRPRVRGDLLQGEAGGGGRGGGDRRGVEDRFLQSATRKSSPCRHSKPSAGGAPHPNLPADVDAHRRGLPRL